jgi:hypothetical protein
MEMKWGLVMKHAKILLVLLVAAALAASGCSSTKSDMNQSAPAKASAETGENYKDLTVKELGKTFYSDYSLGEEEAVCSVDSYTLGGQTKRVDSMKGRFKVDSMPLRMATKNGDVEILFDSLEQDREEGDVCLLKGMVNSPNDATGSFVIKAIDEYGETIRSFGGGSASFSPQEKHFSVRLSSEKGQIKALEIQMGAESVVA